MDSKIKVLCVSPQGGGVSYFRCISPHIKLDEMYSNDFDVDIVPDFDWKNTDELKKYNIITFNKGDFNDRKAFLSAMKFCKENGIKIVLDLDDYWRLPESHPLYAIYKYGDIAKTVSENIALADCVTTTTDIFARKIKKYNKNVVILPNSIDTNEEEFKPCNDRYDGTRKLRIGFIMGSTHLKDMEQLDGLVRSLSPGLLEKVQFVLCGFDLKGSVTSIDPMTGEHTVRDIKPTETTWFKYENILTDGYRLLSPDYIKHLISFTPNVQYPNVDNEIYRREWTKNMKNYATHYDGIDVLFVPLEDNEFNCCKSELKMIEAGFKNRPIVMSNVGPYTIGSRSIFLKGGDIDPNGNCVLIDPAKKHKAWAKTIKKLVEHPEYLDIMRDNLHKDITEKYDLRLTTEKRAKLYKSLLDK